MSNTALPQSFVLATERPKEKDIKESFETYMKLVWGGREQNVSVSQLNQNLSQFMDVDATLLPQSKASEYIPKLVQMFQTHPQQYHNFLQGFSKLSTFDTTINAMNRSIGNMANSPNVELLPDGSAKAYLPENLSGKEQEAVLDGAKFEATRLKVQEMARQMTSQKYKLQELQKLIEDRMRSARNIVGADLPSTVVDAISNQFNKTVAALMSFNAFLYAQVYQQNLTKFDMVPYVNNSDNRLSEISTGFKANPFLPQLIDSGNQNFSMFNVGAVDQI